MQIQMDLDCKNIKPDSYCKVESSWMHIEQLLFGHLNASLQAPLPKYLEVDGICLETPPQRPLQSSHTNLRSLRNLGHTRHCNACINMTKPKHHFTCKIMRMGFRKVICVGELSCHNTTFNATFAQKRHCIDLGEIPVFELEHSIQSTFRPWKILHSTSTKGTLFECHGDLIYVHSEQF